MRANSNASGRVPRNDIELNSVNVVFGNGVERIKFDERIREGGESAVINLKTLGTKAVISARLNLITIPGRISRAKRLLKW